MANESLARIMYGTSEELHASHSGTVFPAVAGGSTPEGSSESAAEETLGELLHRVWLNVSGKR